MGTIKIEKFSKNIKGVPVLNNISMELTGGHIYGLKGKNGSGKTMLMRAVCGLILPSAGCIKIDGKIIGRDISFPPSIGVLLENPAFINSYTGRKNLQILADIKHEIGDTEIDEALEKVGLDPLDKRIYRKYSLGMKQRLGIAAAIMEKPDIIILDEPINALDESGAQKVREILCDLRDNGKLIIIACHDTEELEYLSDEIFVLSEGRLLSA